jgi:hypothetical protein
MFVLRLNHKRMPKIEMTEPVCWSDNEGEIERFLEQEKVAIYTEPKNPNDPEGEFWGKTYRKGGPLEWYNQPYGSGGIITVTQDEAAERAKAKGDTYLDGIEQYVRFRKEFPNVRSLLGEGIREPEEEP